MRKSNITKRKRHRAQDNTPASPRRLAAGQAMSRRVLHSPFLLLYHRQRKCAFKEFETQWLLERVDPVQVAFE